ncbi:uncharacterized protein B0I36DRAFT_293662 [Microdochium trichocladiopsis]|uniref:Polyamine transport protein n=1 Tax=Microdochium trichocladiopsis TaxID=1682393 RepID=A0A9P8XZG3_9PEZI|nr:uncharacterized protein B0I36DRAFT_293662 [Microdochium trichocladiopsis]KAH7025953.1 hypothetical protein B0I36DRAFT_293662 [Microdochium trichocladiopsis]
MGHTIAQKPTHSGRDRSRRYHLRQRGRSSRPQHSTRLRLHQRSCTSLQQGREPRLSKSLKRKPIARDWPLVRKRLAAAVACLNTALIGVNAGIYAGALPSIQYAIVDLNHSMVFGNVGFFLGLALVSFMCWPLPLLHGRKPYVVCGLSIALPLIFPQAIVVSAPRSPSTPVWEVVILVSRTLMGSVLGLTSMNCHAMLTDLFGASLMSTAPHQELMDQRDLRRHGGGLGVWLGLWTWCFVGSIALGFLVGGLVIDNVAPANAFYVCIGMTACVLVVNVLCPEVRRSSWRRYVAEVQVGQTISRCPARGEIMMQHINETPRSWGQDVYHGLIMSMEMLRQPGFAVMTLFAAWVYAQVVLIIILLASLSSRLYHLRPTYVGAVVSSIAIGALAAVPFQKASIFSRSRYHPQRTNSMTFDQTFTWTSHLVRRAIFVLALPLVAALYVVVSTGPPLHIAAPSAFAALIGFLSCLGISECNGMLMENWDCSDLLPVTEIHQGSRTRRRLRSNYSSFPRVSAGLAITHSLSFVLAGFVTIVGGLLQRNLSQRAASGAVAGILLVLSCLLLAVLVRFRNVQIIPASRIKEMDRWTVERRISLHSHARALAIARSQGRTDLDDTVAEEPRWRPLLLGNPTRKHRRMNLLELGALSRWSEIRKLNRLVDHDAHLNRQAVRAAQKEIGRRANELVGDLHALGDVVGSVSRRSLRSLHSHSHSHSHDSDTEPSTKHMSREIGMHAPVAGATAREPHTVNRATDTFGERERHMVQIVEEELERFTVGDWSNSEEVSSGSSGQAVGHGRQQNLHKREATEVGEYGMTPASARGSNLGHGPR